jgi:SAM-dependent methyltransferase
MIKAIHAILAAQVGGLPIHDKTEYTIPVRENTKAAIICPTEKEWFTAWFNSPYYPILYKNRDEHEARFFMDNLMQYLGMHSQNKVLDMGCGRGRHAMYLNSRGMDVTGIDIAPESIAYARQFENERLHCYVHDMRQPFGTHEFCYVLNLFTSFGYFATEAENIQVIWAATQALRKGGRLVIDFMNVHKIMEGLVSYELKEVEGIRFEISRRVENSFIVKDIDVTHQGISYHFQERVKALCLDDFLYYFDIAGITLRHVFGNYALNPYHPHTADRLILIAEV